MTKISKNQSFKQKFNKNINSDNDTISINREYPHVSKYYNFFKETYTEFNKQNSSTSIRKTDLLNKLPYYLKDGKNNKKIINKWGKNVTQVEFEELILTQTCGKKYPNFDYLVIKYDLELDKNHMIVFTKEFPFTKKIKKESLFIWGIFSALKNHPFIGKFYNKLEHRLQSSHESDNIIDNRNKKRYDLEFTKLHLAIEIDEDHTSEKVQENDILKTAILKLNGLCLIRLDFRLIYNGKFIDDNIDINYEMYNSEAYGNFIQELYDKVICSMLKYDKQFFDEYIIELFKKSMSKDLVELEVNINAIKNKISNQSINIKNNREELHNLQKELKYNFDAFKKIKISINDISSESDFKELFMIKNNYNLHDISIDTKIIAFDKIISILKSNPEDIISLKELLNELGIISSFRIESKDIFINWKQLSSIIINYKDDNLKNSLLLYYLTLEQSYEIIIEKIKRYGGYIEGDKKSYNLCFSNEAEKIKNAYEEKYKKILLENQKLNNRIKKLEDDLQDINLHYNKYIDNNIVEGIPLKRCDANIKYNKINNISVCSLEDKIDSSNYIKNVKTNIDEDEIEKMLADIDEEDNVKYLNELDELDKKINTLQVNDCDIDDLDDLE